MGSMKLLVALLLLLIGGQWQQVQAAKILCIVATPDHNNPSWALPFFEMLAERGHSLTVIGPKMHTGLSTTINNIPVANNYNVVSKHYVNDKGYYHRYWDVKHLLIWYEAMLGSCRSMIETEFFKNLNNANWDYDLIIYDATYSLDCLLTKLPALHPVPIMALSSGKLTTDLMRLVKAENTINAATIPHFTSRLPLAMNYWQRIQNNLLYLSEVCIKKSVIYPILNGMLQKEYFNPTVQVALLNTHPVLDYAQNIPPNVVEVGGLHIQSESNPLAANIQEFADKFTEGIIYIDLPYIDLMYGIGMEAIELMITEFGQFGFIWNVHNVKIPKLSQNLNNLITVNAVDNMQQDILAHSSMKVFLTHGDSFSLQVAIYNAVPVIVLPLLMDQINNAQRVQERYLGVHISATSIDPRSFLNALMQIARNGTYMDTLQQAQLNFRTRQSKPVDVAVWYAEQLVSQPEMFGHLSPAESQEHSYFVNQSFDVLFPMVLFVVLCMANLAYLIYHNFVSGMAKKKTKERATSKQAADKKAKNKLKVDKTNETKKDD